MSAWGRKVPIEVVPNENFQESKLLRLDWSKAEAELGWRPVLDIQKAVSATVEWYKAWSEGSDMAKVTDRQGGAFWGLVE